VDQKDVTNVSVFTTVKMENAKTADLILATANNAPTLVHQNQPAKNVLSAIY